MYPLTIHFFNHNRIGFAQQHQPERRHNQSQQPETLQFRSDLVQRRRVALFCHDLILEAD